MDQGLDCIFCGESYPENFLPEHVKDCDLREIRCDQCDERVMFRFLNDHISEDCKANQFAEEVCVQCMESFISKYKNDHYAICPANTQIYCEYCSELIIKLHLNDHLKDCPLYQISQIYQHQKVEECPICLIDMLPTDSRGNLECLHQFHKSCLAAWIAREKICPVCRLNI